MALTTPSSAAVAGRTDRLFLIGTVAGSGVRAVLFLLSFGVFAPGVGYPVSNAISAGHGDIADLAIAVVLLAAGIYGATGARSRRYVYIMGLIFALDVVAYSVSIALSYRGEGAPIWFPVVLIGIQVPFLVLATALIRRGFGDGR